MLITPLSIQSTTLARKDTRSFLRHCSPSFFEEGRVTKRVRFVISCVRHSERRRPFSHFSRLRTRILQEHFASSSPEEFAFSRGRVQVPLRRRLELPSVPGDLPDAFILREGLISPR